MVEKQRFEGIAVAVEYKRSTLLTVNVKAVRPVRGTSLNTYGVVVLRPLTFGVLEQYDALSLQRYTAVAC